MTNDPKDFWRSVQTGLAVAVAGSAPEKLLGIRDGCRRFFTDRLGRDLPIAVVPWESDVELSGMPMSDRQVLRRAARTVRAMERELGAAYQLYAVCEGGIHVVEPSDEDGGDPLYFVRSWTVLRGPWGEAVGGGGAVQLPARMLDGLSGSEVSAGMPGTRRSGGMIASITGGLADRRSATAQATVHALSTLFYGILETPSVRRRS